MSETTGGSIEACNVIWIDNLHVYPVPRSRPEDFKTLGIGLNPTGSHNVATPAYNLGDAFWVKNPGPTHNGWAKFVYGQFVQGSAIAALSGSALIPGTILVSNVNSVPSVEGAAATLSGYPFVFSNLAADKVAYVAGQAVVGLTAMTPGNYGWFLCEGIMPVDFFAGASGTVPLPGMVYAAGSYAAVGPLTLEANSSYIELTGDIQASSGAAVMPVAIANSAVYS